MKKLLAVLVVAAAIFCASRVVAFAPAISGCSAAAWTSATTYPDGSESIVYAYTCNIGNITRVLSVDAACTTVKDSVTGNTFAAPGALCTAISSHKTNIDSATTTCVGAGKC